MKERALIQMTFDTCHYMRFDFIYHLLEELDLLNEGLIQLSYSESFKYRRKNVYEKLNNIPYLNYIGFRFALITHNEMIDFKICNPYQYPITRSFSQIQIECDKKDMIVEKYINILLKLFKNDFFMIHVLDVGKYNKHKTYVEKLKFIKNKRYSILNKIMPLSIYEETGVNVGLSYQMYFGKYMYKFFDKETLLHCPYVYHIKDENNIIHISLYQSLQQKQNLSIERQIRKYLRIDELALQLIDGVSFENKYRQWFIERCKKYALCFQDDDHHDSPQENIYIIPIYHLDLVLKKYKHTCFEKIDEDFGAGEIIGFFMYKREGEAIAFKKMDDIEAYMIVELFDISSNIDEYAKENGYHLSKIKENQYLFERENNEVIEKFNYFIMDNNEPHYRISLLVHKLLLDEKEMKKIISEYDKIVKSSKLKVG
ncbi:MAG: hypothetical protein ACLUVC_13250 [Longibaculum sp.]